MRSLRFFFLLVFLVGLFFCGCQRQDDFCYNKFSVIGQRGWDYQDTIVFEIDSLSEGQHYVELMLRTNKRAAFRCLYVAVEQDFGKIFKDTLKIVLADTLGKTSGSGLSLKQHCIRLKRPLKLSSSRSGTFRLYHLMRSSCIKDVEDLGIRIGR